MKEITLIEFVLVVGLAGSPVFIIGAIVFFIIERKVFKHNVKKCVLFTIIELVMAVLFSAFIWAIWPDSIGFFWCSFVPLPAIISQVVIYVPIIIRWIKKWRTFIIHDK